MRVDIFPVFRKCSCPLPFTARKLIYSGGFLDEYTLHLPGCYITIHVGDSQENTELRITSVSRLLNMKMYFHVYDPDFKYVTAFQMTLNEKSCTDMLKWTFGFPVIGIALVPPRVFTGLGIQTTVLFYARAIAVIVVYWTGCKTYRIIHNRPTCISKLTIISSDNGLSPGRRQAIISTTDGIFLIGPLGTNFSEIVFEIHTFSFKKMHLKLSSGRWRPFCLGLNGLNLEEVVALRSFSIS